MLGVPQAGDYLAIVKYVGAINGVDTTVYKGKSVTLPDFTDSSGDGVADLAVGQFRLIRVISKDGGVKYQGGKHRPTMLGKPGRRMATCGRYLTTSAIIIPAHWLPPTQNSVINTGSFVKTLTIHISTRSRSTI